MKHALPVVALALVALGGAPARAQSPDFPLEQKLTWHDGDAVDQAYQKALTPPTPPLTWRDCLEFALKNNPSYVAAVKALDAARTAYEGSYSLLTPSLSLSNTYSASSSQEVLVQGTNIVNPSHWGAVAVFNWPLLNFGNIFAIRADLALEDQAKANLRQASVTLRYDLREAYAELLYAQNYLATSKLILDLRRKNYQIVELEYDSGVQSIGDYMRVQAEEMQQAADYANAKRNLLLAQRALDAQLGLDDFGVIAVTGTLDTASLPPYSAEDMAAYVEDVPAVQLQEAVLAQDKAVVGQAWGSLLPSLNLTYTRAVLGTGEPPSSLYSWTGGGSLSLPIFGGGQGLFGNFYNEEAARRTEQSAVMSLRYAREGARTALESSWQTLAGDMDNVQVEKALLAADRRRNAEQDVLYEAGLVTFDIWEVTIGNRVGDEKGVLSAELSAANAEAGWLQARGIGLEDSP